MQRQQEWWSIYTPPDPHKGHRGRTGTDTKWGPKGRRKKPPLPRRSSFKMKFRLNSRGSRLRSPTVEQGRRRSPRPLTAVAGKVENHDLGGGARTPALNSSTQLASSGYQRAEAACSPELLTHFRRTSGRVITPAFGAIFNPGELVSGGRVRAG